MADRTLSVTIAQDTPTPLDVAFSCAPGDVLGIYGPSGSGKTTILRTIAGLHTPAKARVSAGGDLWLDTAAGVARAAHKRAVGYVFQEYALFPHLTAIDNVLVALGHHPPAERRARASDLLESVGLAAAARRRPAALSGGERQRVALARALARDPAVLLLDEPFSAVDRAVRGRLHDLIDTIRRSLDIPVVLVTHDFDDITRLASHLLLIDAGAPVAIGPVREVTARTDLSWLGASAGLGAVLDATVAEVDPARGLAQLDYDGGRLVAPDMSLAPGQRVRLRIPARDVILATDVPAGLSLHNAVAGTVTAVDRDDHSHRVVVQLQTGRERILAEVTRDAVTRLDIRPGRMLFALIKSVSLQILPLG